MHTARGPWAVALTPVPRLGMWEVERPLQVRVRNWAWSTSRSFPGLSLAGFGN